MSDILSISVRRRKTMGGKNFLRMMTDQSASEAATKLISSDWNELGDVTKKLANHVITLGYSGGFITTILQCFACIAAIYLLVIDRTNWRTKMLTTLLVPYIFLTFPNWLFNTLRGDIGKWICFVGVILRLFFAQYFEEYMMLPGSLILLVVIAPSLVAYYIRDGWIGVGICLAIGCYLLQEHIRASGGFRNAFTRANGISNSIGIVLLFVFPVWALIGFL